MALRSQSPARAPTAFAPIHRGKKKPIKNHETQDTILRSGCSDLQSAGGRSTDQEKHHRLPALLVLSQRSEHPLHRAAAPGQRQSGAGAAAALSHRTAFLFLSSGYSERIGGVALLIAGATVASLA